MNRCARFGPRLLNDVVNIGEAETIAAIQHPDNAVGFVGSGLATVGSVLSGNPFGAIGAGFAPGSYGGKLGYYSCEDYEDLSDDDDD